MTIDRAAQLLANDDGEAALEALVEHWRTWPAPELAAVIDALATKLAAKLPPVTGAGSTSDRQAFAQLAAEKLFVTLPRLFEALPKSNGIIARERIFALAAFPVNPLISGGMAKWLEQPPFSGTARARCFPPALDVLAKHQDPRTVAVLQKRVEEERRSATIRALGLSAWKPLVALAKEALDWRKPRAATPEETAALAQLTKKLGEEPAPPRAGVKAEALFAAVYADPEDDGARLVLADFLQEANEPRGELIAIQVARASSGGPVSRREKELLGQWGRDWLGPLNGLCMREGVVFERGFPVRAAYNGHRPPGHHTLAEWATLTHLEVVQANRNTNGARAILLGPAVTSLRHVSGVGHPDLRGISESTNGLPWESLHCALWSLEHADAPQVLGKANLPALRRLAIMGASPSALHGATPDLIAKLLDAPVGKQIHHFEIGMRPPDFGAVIDLCAARKLTSVTLRPTSRDLALTYDVASRGVVIRLEPASDSSIDGVEVALQSVRRGVIDRAVLHLKQPKKAAGLRLAGLKAALNGAPLDLA